MKKVYLFISLMLSALAVGCNDSNTPDDAPTKPGVSDKVVVTVNATLYGDSKWAAGDKVAINGLESAAVTEEGAGSATYSFVTSELEAPVVVVAPFEALTGFNESSLPATQEYVADGHDSSAYVMAGLATEIYPVTEGDDKNLAADVDLKPIVGVVSLPLTLDAASAGPVSIKKISFTSKSGRALNGSWSASVVKVQDIPAEGETAEPVEPTYSYTIALTESGNNTATTNLSCGDGVAISSSPVYFNIVVPAGVYTGGFEVVISDTAEHNYILDLSEDVAVDAGSVTTLAASQFVVVDKAPATLSVTLAGEGFVWQEGDQVICNNELSKNAIDAAAAGTKSASFEFDAVAYPYSVFYPAEFYSTSGSLRFYEEQTISKSGVDRNLMVMAGYSATNEVTLNPLYGVVTIPITNMYEGESIALDKVEVRSQQGDPITGKYSINYRTGALSVVAGKDAITLIPAEEGFVIQPNETAEISFIVPKGNVRNGLVLNIYSSVGLVENHQVFPTGLSVYGGETLTADAYTYQEVKIDAIRTAEELVDFAKCVNMGRYKKYVNENGEVVLGNDIDMSTLSEWTPITGAVNAETGLPTGFDGVFNGQGFQITNWVTTQPLFGYLGATGIVKNLVIANSCGLVIPELSPYTLDGKDGSNYCFAFVVASNMAGTVEDVINYASVRCTCPDDSYAQTRAAIVGYTAVGGNIRRCINYGDVTLELANHISQTAYIGTVSGRFASNADNIGCGIYDCENHGDLTITFTDGKTSKNLYIGGVTGSSNSYTVTSGCKNYGDVTVNTTYAGAMLALGGITPYSAGEIKDCINEGNISHNNTGNIKGAIVAGIAAYQNGPISNCINKGNIYNAGKKFEGRNSIGSIDGTKSTSSAAPAAAGIVGYAYSSSGSPFSMDNCHNYGKITYLWTEADGSGTSGCTSVAGIIAAPWGDVTNCNNYGDIEFSATLISASSTVPNHLSRIGGIAGSDYYSKSQSESSIINCTNEGNLTVHSDVGTSNSNAAGIIGWPGKESACTNVTQGCVNKGNIVVSGISKFRAGGIQGGSGIIIDCVNEGDITINSSNSASNYGGLAGFHSGGYELKGSTNTGNIVANVAISGGGVAGMAGNLGNAAHAAGKIVNNTINCIVKAVDGTCGAGLVVGHFNGKTKEIYFGTEDEPIKVAGSLQIGEVVTVVDATNCNDPAVLGSGCANYDPAVHFYNCVLAQ